jgi:hypothetical protein
MKIYFSAAIAQKDKFGSAYEEIVEALESLGHTVYQDTTLVSLHEAINKTAQQRIAYYRQVLQWITQADVVVLEVSFPSTLHIGHEVSLALKKAKPVVALYQKGYEPSFFLGLTDERVFWEQYRPGQVKRILEQALADAVHSMESKYNFFMRPPQLSYLTKKARNLKMPRASYLRKLIEADMENNFQWHSEP